MPAINCTCNCCSKNVCLAFFILALGNSINPAAHHLSSYGLSARVAFPVAFVVCFLLLLGFFSDLKSVAEFLQDR